jgi:hypothetical protein
MFLFAPLAAAMIALCWKKGRRLIAALAVILVAVMTIAPWTARNWLVFKSFVPLTTQTGESLYASYVPTEGRLFGMMPRNDAIVDYAAQNMDKVQRDRFMSRQAFKYIRENPAQVIKMLPLKLMFFFSPFDWEILSARGVYNFSYCFLFPFFVIGLLRAKLKTAETLISALPFFYLLAMSLILYGNPRFRLSGEIVMIAFASYAIASLFPRRILPLSAWAAANAALFIFSDHLKYLLKVILEGAGLW